ncbi:hypothetical protein scyTo_0024195 [Scyliorhinus torazame]|uniref:Uncharacterized protein n=1 Tax=Scyliorhinus torazame TaxID=75743 RepID=A0A401QEL6_SCYTO|nr:hypothetical protein [Scyliorhinus torazame]
MCKLVTGCSCRQLECGLFPQKWSGPEKLLALDELIDRCETSQIKYMMQVIEPQFQRDFISLLPKEVRVDVGISTCELLMHNMSETIAFTSHTEIN